MDFGGGLLGVGVGGSGFVGAPEAAGGGVCFSPPMGSPSDAAAEPGGRAGCWGFGSGMAKPTRTVCGPDDDGVDWRYAKLPRSDDGCSASRAASSMFPDGQQMLSFSTTPKVAENLVLPGEGVLSCCYSVPSSASTSSSPPVLAAATSSSPAGMAYGANGSLGGDLYGLPTGMRGGVLPSPQWLELEQQALIYKYMDANSALPSGVLGSFRAGYNPCGYNKYSAGSLAPGAFGWGSSLRQGFSDPEPGRCRRTDGKKWRCSRDAVADQKYCERHMNRGRHRSRKPVEGLSGHAKAMPVVAPMPSASAEAATSAAGGVTNTVGMMHQQTKTMLSCSNMFSRNLMNKEGETNHQIHDQQRLSMSISSNSERLNVLNSYNPFEDQPSMETASGLMSSNNPLINLSNSCMSNGGYGTIPDTSDKEFDQPNLMHHFFDNWPKNQPNQSRNAWNDTEDNHGDRTQLSISMPAGSSALAQEKHSLAQLRLSREIDPIHIELGIGSGADNGQREQQATWGAPISWGASMGGPLGEVLNTTNNTCGGGDHMKDSSSALSLMVEDWESSPQMGSTPTGVLQNTAFGSLASSAGSSPRADNFNNLESTIAAGGRLCSDLIGSALINSTAIPTL